MESQVVVDDAVANMVRFEEVFECARSLLRVLFDVVDLYGGDLDTT